MMIRNILLIEDNKGDVLLTEEAFRDADIGASFTIAHTGESALHLLHIPGMVLPDLILLDINLPGFNGNDLVAMLKKDELLKTIPVLILTTSASEYDRSEVLRSGAIACIEKPIDTDKFKTILTNIGYTVSATG